MQLGQWDCQSFMFFDIWMYSRSHLIFKLYVNVSDDGATVNMTTLSNIFHHEIVAILGYYAA